LGSENRFVELLLEIGHHAVDSQTIALEGEGGFVVVLGGFKRRDGRIMKFDHPGPDLVGEFGLAHDLGSELAEFGDTDLLRYYRLGIDRQRHDYKNDQRSWAVESVFHFP